MSWDAAEHGRHMCVSVHRTAVLTPLSLLMPSCVQGSGSVLATRNLHVLRRLVAADIVRAAAASEPHGGALMAHGDLDAALAVPPEVRQQLSSVRKVIDGRATHSQMPHTSVLAGCARLLKVGWLDHSVLLAGTH